MDKPNGKVPILSFASSLMRSLSCSRSREANLFRQQKQLPRAGFVPSLECYKHVFGDIHSEGRIALCELVESGRCQVVSEAKRTRLHELIPDTNILFYDSFEKILPTSPVVLAMLRIDKLLHPKRGRASTA